MGNKKIIKAYKITIWKNRKPTKEFFYTKSYNLAFYYRTKNYAEYRIQWAEVTEEEYILFSREENG